jgi:hypothetical protein
MPPPSEAVERTPVSHSFRTASLGLVPTVRFARISVNAGLLDCAPKRSFSVKVPWRNISASRTLLLLGSSPDLRLESNCEYGLFTGESARLFRAYILDLVREPAAAGMVCPILISVADTPCAYFFWAKEVETAAV